MWPPVIKNDKHGKIFLLLKLGDNKCPSKWLIGKKGFLQPMAKALVKVEPTNNPPIKPGPQVAQNKSISSNSILASFKALGVIDWRIYIIWNIINSRFIIYWQKT